MTLEKIIFLLIGTLAFVLLMVHDWQTGLYAFLLIFANNATILNDAITDATNRRKGLS